MEIKYSEGGGNWTNWKKSILNNSGVYNIKQSNGTTPRRK